MNYLAAKLLVPTRGILPNPRPQAPPGVEGVNTVLNWASYGVMISGLAALLGGAGYLIWAAFMGREAKGVKICVIAIIGGILGTAAAPIMRVFV